MCLTKLHGNDVVWLKQLCIKLLSHVNILPKFVLYSTSVCVCIFSSVSLNTKVLFHYGLRDV